MSIVHDDCMSCLEVVEFSAHCDIRQRQWSNESAEAFFCLILKHHYRALEVLRVGPECVDGNWIVKKNSIFVNT